MDTTKKVRQQGQRREKVDFSKAVKASTAVDPDLEKKQDFSDRLVRELEALISKVDGSGDGDLSLAPNLFKLCVHPKSFSQTVENFFHLSFVVKQGLAQITNHEGEPVVIATAKAEGKQEKADNPEQHLIFELNMQDWYNDFDIILVHFDCFELDLRGHTQVWGATLSCLRLKWADMVLI